MDREKSRGDMDFNDVFGGPPKRFSMQEIRMEEEEGRSEKPVFGDEVRARRRQQQGDEFFNDIFKGSPHSHSASNSGSRINESSDEFVNNKIQYHHTSSVPELAFSSGRDDDDDDDETLAPPPPHNFHFSIYKWGGRGLPMLDDNSSGSGRRMDIRCKPPVNNQTQSRETKPKTPTLDGIRNTKANSFKLNKGQLKEFVHIFNQQGNDVVAPKQDDELPHVSFKVVEDLNNYRQPSQPSTNPNFTISSDDPNMSVENADDPNLDDNFMVEEIFDTQENIKESTSSDDVTNAIDAKIRQWSVGKKGNIRSLLSTLQYVLWVESGWKAVPLVDLIEANSVKRAYQKALLRLHPDKLQQKGAPFHHKYTAQKVFDILQEAWDHFNTCSSIV